jgi:hypothetical protein
MSYSLSPEADLLLTCDDIDWEHDVSFEPAGSEPFAMGSITKCVSFWRTFVKSRVVMDWIDNGYKLLWETVAPVAKEPANAPSAFKHREFVNDAIKEMVEVNAITRISRDQRPTMVSPIGVVTKPHSDKFRLVINMRYVNKHLAKKVFKFERLADLAEIAEKGDLSVSHALKSA